MPSSNEIAAQFADMLVSPEYRSALNAAFDQFPEQFTVQRERAQAIMLGALSLDQPLAERYWEMRRQAALSHVNGRSLGPFNHYIQQHGGGSEPNTLTIDDLPDGHPEIVHTNNRLVTLNNHYGDPVDFLKNALDVIDYRRQTVVEGVGPENYATVIKHFADKYKATGGRAINRDDITGPVSRCMNGFERISRRDRPNFVEMTNIYYAIRELPAGSFAPEFSPMLLAHSIEQLPTYNRPTLTMLMGALGKIDVSQNGETAAALLDLTFRKLGVLENAHDMRLALRALAQLPGGRPANAAFGGFLLMRNDAESILDISSIDEINQRLVSIAHTVVDDPSLIDQARSIAREGTRQAADFYNRQQNLNEMTPIHLQDLARMVERITSNYEHI